MAVLWCCIKKNIFCCRHLLFDVPKALFELSEVVAYLLNLSRHLRKVPEESEFGHISCLDCYDIKSPHHFNIECEVIQHLFSIYKQIHIFKLLLIFQNHWFAQLQQNYVTSAPFTNASRWINRLIIGLISRSPINQWLFYLSAN